ncbi:hypothetical protein Tco_1065606 [Tanacetum coccineum]
MTLDEFWKVHRKVDQVLHEIIPQLAEKSTNDLIEGNVKRDVNNVIQVHPTITTSIAITSSADLQQKLYLKMKRSLQDQANDPELWDVLKQFTSYVSKQLQKQQECDTWVEETIIDKDEVIPEDETPELITEFQNVDKRIPIIFDHARMEATLDDMLKNQFRNAKDYAYHVKQATNFIENQIV